MYHFWKAGMLWRPAQKMLGVVIERINSAVSVVLRQPDAMTDGRSPARGM